ncbi:Hypothetical Protein FCC1311_054592 [Hondaea fermentalgiana]|uniref:Uncharacterized protein n=1 Tax=Hondaea fermentalgiana TaxID=2315210 RepID=A0A2R5GE74_9STRA|nr:Hypothetical Protein FCC1311_054592 [Hondaea fermentalgiana]|eukprot:GBG29237.1 Hypothetical Protein FCC1311_054592 [Hondaea fermentalgiana]
MFCLDYALAFAVHYVLCGSRPAAPDANTPATPGSADLTGATGEKSDGGVPRWARETTAGAAAGLAAAVALYPFDVLRQSAVQRGTSSFAASTVPFMAVYLGIFFTAVPSERPAEFSTKARTAVAAATAAAVVEFPLDKAKHAIAGGNRGMALATSAARIPLSAFLLLAYDHMLRAAQQRRQLEATRS